MAGNNSIQFLRGNNISGSDEELLPGQPAYDLTTKYLYVGDGSKISETSPIKASFADDAENVTSTINGKNISDIFEENGTTAKEATNSPKSLYNLGAFDTYVDNGDGTVTVTRKTGRYNVPSNDFVLDANNCFQQNITLPNTDKYFAVDHDPESGSDHATSNVYPLGKWGTDDTFYTSPDNWLRVFDNSYSKDEAGLAQFKASLEAAGGMYILYETDTSYQEKLPANVPINTLDANMSDIVRDEVEKTLNLFNGVWEQGTFDPEGGDAPVASRVRSPKMQLDAGVYNLSLSGADEQGIYIFNNDGSIKQEFDWAEIGTFTLSESGIISIACRKSDDSDISPEDIQNTMLVKGSNSYPYQPYNGAIVHEKQLGGYLPLTGGTVNGNLSITGQLDFGSLSTRAANALLSMVELSPTTIQSSRQVSHGGANAAWSYNGTTWSYSSYFLPGGIAVDIETSGDVSYAEYNSQSKRINYTISVTSNPGNYVRGGTIRYRIVRAIVT